MSHQFTAASAAGLTASAIWGVLNLPVAFAEGELPLSTKLAEYGVSGVLISVIIYIVYLLLNKTLQGRETDLLWHREELARKASLFQSLMEAELKSSHDKQNYIVDKFTASIEKLEGKLATRAEDLIKLVETMRNVNDTLEDVKTALSGWHEIQKVRYRNSKDKDDIQ
jgi:hypothetical protein